MKKNTAITLGVVLVVLLIGVGVFVGMNSKKTNINPPSQTETIDFIKEAAKTSDSIDKKNKERVEIKNIGKSEYQSIAIIQGDEDGHGTGFVVSKNKLLTNEHVTRDLTGNVIARFKNENDEVIDFKITNIINSPNNRDLSIVEVAPDSNGKNIGDYVKTFELATREEIDNIKLGDSVHTVGYPGDKDYGTLWYSKGKVTFNDNFIIAFDAFIEGGNSGSPLFNNDGKVIGLTQGNNLEGEKSVSFGVLLDKDLYNFVKENI